MRQPRNTPGLRRALAGLTTAIRSLWDDEQLGGMDRKQLREHLNSIAYALALVLVEAHEPPPRLNASAGVAAHKDGCAALVQVEGMGTAIGNHSDCDCGQYRPSSEALSYGVRCPQCGRWETACLCTPNAVGPS